jgi:PQQ-dependent dehydrogenase (methanol/ethanol family)
MFALEERMAVNSALHRLGSLVTACGLAALAAWNQPTGAQTANAPARRASPSGDVDWRSHNFDVRNQHYSPVEEINASNVAKLTLKWSFKMGGEDIITQVTPVVVDGVMYFNAGSKLFAVDAATGRSLWTTEVQPAFRGAGLGRRGPTYANGRIYAYGETFLYAVDAKTGKVVESFGNKGRLLVADAALRFKYGDRDPIGYEIASPPAFHDGTLYLGLAQSERHIQGGLVAAIDGATGAVKWVFNTIPQQPADDGWAAAGNTWVGGARHGGGVWFPPAIDPDLGMLYVNVANPDPSYEGTARKGMNLFTNSIVALNLQTGKLVWYYQTVHHDIWDLDLVTGPLLFDVEAGGRTIKGVATAGKNCFLYFFHRDTGKPINPIVETAVPTATDVPGEEPWPTQPFPYTATGVPMQPFCATFPIISDPEISKRARQFYTPYSTKEFYIVSHGGSSFGSPSFSPRTGLYYVTGKNGAVSFTVKIMGTNLPPNVIGSVGTTARRDYNMGLTPSQTVTAYNPVTGEVVWQDVHPTKTHIFTSGNLATGGDLVFQGSDTGDFYALDARTGKKLFTYTAAEGVRANPLTYRIAGHQYVSVVAANTLLTFGLP